ncbi:uncharacterized protein LOC129305821 isoform X2 [Prosopis cineraria]|uniref:uncharacterized protein LOC129305821 isoform X2 n=1 Tax=Prosopis cineraria TaxID=364024 RepID=UPI0024106BD2|nr:uncharacterized protein LOC129305821 isoform X2 [Prosopis cineraria]
MSSLLGKKSSMMNINCFKRNIFSASSPLPAVPLPAKKEVHFWYILPDEVNSPNLLNQYLEILSPCEKENIFRMRGELLKKRALLARTLVRTTLARYWQYFDDWSLPPLHFNISHTSSLIACGVAMDYPIGIDVEEKQRRLKNNILAFARRYFTLYELEMLAGISDPETQRQEFVKLWTLKEAYVKALGKGFSASPFNKFTVRLGDSMKKGTCHVPDLISEAPEIVIESSGDPNNPSRNWQFVLLELLGSHYAAICMEQDMISGGNGGVPINLTIRKTTPFVEDEYISGADVAVVGGLTRL